MGYLVLSAFSNCRGEPVRPTRARIETWRTPQGIGLGSPESAILRAYGAPVDRWRVARTSIVRSRTPVPNPGPVHGVRAWE